MKFRTIFRFELAYQARSLLTWGYFVALAVVAFLFVRGNFLADALYAEFYVNSPFVVAVVTVFCCMFSLLVTSAITGEAAARDVAMGMHPLTYTTPVRKAEYLGGRFLAAFVLNAVILLAVPVGVLLAVYAPGVDAEVIGPFRPAAYLTAYGFLALPNAFIGTAIQFAWGTLGRRIIASYLGSVLLVFVAYGGIVAVFYFLDRQGYAQLLDFFGQLTVLDQTFKWTNIEKSTRLLELEGSLLHSRLLWVGIALGALALTYVRFRFVHPTATPWWNRLTQRHAAQASPPAGNEVARRPVAVRQIRQTFGFTTYLRQTRAITGASFRMIARSPAGPVLLTVIAAIAVAAVPQNLENMGTPLLPRTGYVLTFLTAALTNFMTPWVGIPLLIILWTGELVWREREVRLGEITDAAPVPEWVFFLGKFLGLGLVLVLWMALLLVAGVLLQVRMGYDTFEIGLYLQILFGLQLPEYLLLALLALVVQGLIRQKYVGQLVTLLGYILILFSSQLGLHHHLLVYGSGPAWAYSDLRGFGASLGPWGWFKAYWFAWGLGLAVVARLLWVRGLEGDPRVRVRVARRRFTRPTARIAAVAAGLILALGGLIFYNTNILNRYTSAFERAERHAEYERRYGRYARIPQPLLTASKLRIEIYPERRAVEIRGTYQLVNRTAGALDSVHVATIPGVETGAITFDQPATPVLVDQEHGHRIYALKTPLQPGAALQLRFTVQVEPKGFRNEGINPFVTAGSTFFKSTDWLPAIGYQPRRALLKPGDRRAHNLPARPLIGTLADAEASQDVTEEGIHELTDAGGIAFEAVVGTDADQVAVAPGALRRTWTEGGRRYFRYVADTPIGNEQRFFSSAYAVREDRWQHPSANSGRAVAIQIYHHPTHAANVDRMLRSVRASLTNYSREFGPYPYGYLRLVENPGQGMGAHSEPTTIDYTEGFSRFNPADDSLGLDFPFAIIAHEIAHQWWGAQLPYAPVEGAGLLTESPAWYSAMGVVEETYGRAHLRRLLRFFRQPYPIPPIRQSVPLLRGRDPYAAYRKGPFALFAMSEYMGKEQVNGAYRRLLEKHSSGARPPATSLDLYRELQAVTPDTLKPLLHDLFAANTFWELKTEQTTATQTTTGPWQVTLRVTARKVTVDSAGVETVRPMDEWVDIGVFAPTKESEDFNHDFGETLYFQRHRIRSGEQILIVTVPRRPADAGIDPYHLLIDLEPFDNVEQVKMERKSSK